MTDKELAVVKKNDQHWKEIGGVVFDVRTMLESLARVNAKGLHPVAERNLLVAQRYGVLVAAHALGSVLKAVNDEQMRWFTQIPQEQ